MRKRAARSNIGRWTKTAVVAAALAAVVLSSTACGGPSAAELADQRMTYLNALEPKVDAVELAKTKVLEAKREANCRARVEGFVASLRALDSKLNIGLTLDEYGNELG